VSIHETCVSLASRLRHPKTTLRWRLTLLYGGLFLVSGVVLLAITYTLVDHATLTSGGFRAFTSIKSGQPARAFGTTTTRPPNALPPSPGQTSVPPSIQKVLKSSTGRTAVRIVGSDQRISDLHQLVVESVIALAVMAIISTLLGWLVAGRVLRPLRTMTATTQEISEANLHRRLAMRGPEDELRELADTIDGLLDRLETAFDGQRQFVANASHELRTPLTAARALLEMVLGDPRATVETFRTTCQQVLEESEQQEQLIDALLALAQGQRGIDHPALVDLAAITRDVVQTREPTAAARGLRLDVALQPAPLSGDPRLIERLISNLVDNALDHNVPNGRVRMLVRSSSGWATLTIANTGPVVPAEAVQRLLQPFQRLVPDRVGHRDGLGLGLSIVAAIADAHHATLEIQPGAEGGLEIRVRFPRAPDGSPPAPSEPRPRRDKVLAVS
jgi:signal transduction histidine kinase